MLRAIYVELYKTFAKPRTYIGILAVIGIISLIQLGFYISKDDFTDDLQNRMGETIVVENLKASGNMIYYFVLHMLFIHLPIIIALVAGDAVSGEMASGTIRSLMTKPLPRWKIFVAKLVANEVYVLAITLVILIFSLYLSNWIFGKGDLVVMTDGISILEQKDLPPRIFKSILLAFVSLSVISSLAFMFSCLMENSVAPIVTTIVLVIVSTILGSLNFEVFEPIQDYLFTSHTRLWNFSFYYEDATRDIMRSLGILSIYIFAFISIAFFSFINRDITQ